MSKETLFYIRLREQASIKNKSMNQVERELGYPRNSLNNYKNGTEPSGERLLELADYFMVSPHYLMGKRETDEGASLKERFQALNFEQKGALCSICQSWVASQLFKNH
ncbi:helix-turn-helix domain-containing protein [Lactococcus lactis]|uniref:Helix-turn-helix domain-containing protein n=1 Tax=Lactococcus lactis TaxID=1358 RepID=A0A9X4NI75_9LACT|nr:helix-turn-helix transcriptional regulator [Lactococcus lactis]MDG4984585.1 helix-turn-helix domain-containing protein [Lactococcus lactis]